MLTSHTFGRQCPTRSRLVESTAVQKNAILHYKKLVCGKTAKLNLSRESSTSLTVGIKSFGIQLRHAGRKSSTVVPFLHKNVIATSEVGGWPDEVACPFYSPLQRGVPSPKKMTLDQIEAFKVVFADATKPAVKADLDVAEIYASHGYLIRRLLSPISNQCKDKYGGSWKNRVRLVLEITDLVRAAIPEVPLFVRISGTDWFDNTKDEFPEGWTVSDSCKLVPILA